MSDQYGRGNGQDTSSSHGRFLVDRRVGLFQKQGKGSDMN